MFMDRRKRPERLSDAYRLGALFGISGFVFMLVSSVVFHGIIFDAELVGYTLITCGVVCYGYDAFTYGKRTKVDSTKNQSQREEPTQT
jgi:predicted membrane channel-forming protein YqfA (hemolysin III family)